VVMSQKGLGMTAIVDQDDHVLGIFTDGDLRRLFDKRQIDVHITTIGEVMVRQCKSANAQILAAEALQLMQKHKINALLIVDVNQKLVGALNMHDLLRAGVV
jgi:arabinose-5-phosphate isomerase